MRSETSSSCLRTVSEYVEEIMQRAKDKKEWDKVSVNSYSEDDEDDEDDEDAAEDLMEEVADVSVDWVRIKQSFMIPLAVFESAAAAHACAHKNLRALLT